MTRHLIAMKRWSYHKCLLSSSTCSCIHIFGVFFLLFLFPLLQSCFYYGWNVVFYCLCTLCLFHSLCDVSFCLSLSHCYLSEEKKKTIISNVAISTSRNKNENLSVWIFITCFVIVFFRNYFLLMRKKVSLNLWTFTRRK